MPYLIKAILIFVGRCVDIFLSARLRIAGGPKRASKLVNKGQLGLAPWGWSSRDLVFSAQADKERVNLEGSEY